MFLLQSGILTELGRRHYCASHSTRDQLTLANCSVVMERRMEPTPSLPHNFLVLYAHFLYASGQD